MSQATSTEFIDCLIRNAVTDKRQEMSLADHTHVMATRTPVDTRVANTSAASLAVAFVIMTSP